MKKIYHLLGVTALRTTLYHPQTDRLVKQFNRTLKSMSMLKKVLAKDKREWDQLVPYVLFAYHEVPRASTRFSPFELILGRDVRGLLDVLKEEWASTKPTEDSM